MNAICGLFWRDGQMVEADQLGRMVDSLAHWRPDATGRWRDGAVGLASLVQWTTPEAQLEKGPWHLDGPDVTIAADARLDNRDDLLRQLGLGARPAGEVTDVELIARAYLKWNTGCPEHLLGDFAFALWDGREQRLFCARDPIGMRPFFYFMDARRFRFASQVCAIFADPGVPRELDSLRMAASLAGVPNLDGRTAFAAVHQLEPASVLCVDARGFRSWKYWELDLHREIRLPRDEDYVDAFEEVLQTAVDARLRAAGRVGFMLSGGLDATTGLALALRGGRIARDRMSAFSWALDEHDDWSDPDERPFIDAFLRENPLDHHYIVSNPTRIFDLPEVMRQHGNGPEDRIDYSQMVPTLTVARDAGVRVILNGMGGDQAASYQGHDYPVECLLRGDWRGLRAEVAGRSALSGRPAWRVAINLLRSYLHPQRLRGPLHFQRVYRLQCNRASDFEAKGIPLSRATADAVGLADFVRRLARPQLPGAWRTPMRAAQIYTLTQMRTLTEQVNAWPYSASYGIEFRSPYLDRRVLEFAVGVPPGQHREAAVGRRLLRRVSLRRLPAKIARRLDKSATMPDVARGVIANERLLIELIARWRTSPTVTRFVDLDRLESSLRLVVTAAKEKAVGWTPVLPVCRGVLFGMFLESIEKSGSGV